MKVAVLGAGAAGLAASLALGRRGHDVTLIERDALVPVDAPWEASFAASRSVPQFLLPHALLAKGRKCLFEHARDVYDELVAAGALEIDMCTKLPLVHKDPDLAGLGARRPMIEWALTRAVAGEPRIDVRDRTKVRGLGKTSSVVDTVVTDREQLSADLVIDATGRASKLPAWLDELGAPRIAQRSTDCGTTGYSRYLELRSQADVPLILSPIAASGDTGYMAFGIFWEDNGTLAVSLSTPHWDRELRVLREDSAHAACSRAIPPLQRFLDVSDPVSGVRSMGRLRNVHREWVVDETPAALGVLPIGDALCHTNPNYAYGLSLAFAQAFGLPDLLDCASGPLDLAFRFHAAFGGELSQRYEFASSLDRARLRAWRGEPVDFSTPAGNLPLFMSRTLPAAGVVDHAIYVSAMRLLHLLDPPELVARDEDLLWRAADIYRERTAGRPPRPLPSRAELLDAIRQPS